MNSELTPKEVAQKTSPIIAALSAIACFGLLHALDSIHLWAMAILVGLVMEYVSSMLIEWSVNKFVYNRVQMLSEAITKVKESSGAQVQTIASAENKDLSLIHI